MKKAMSVKVFACLFFALCVSVSAQKHASATAGMTKDEAEVRAAQLAFEREERINLHLKRAGNFFEEGDFDSAAAEYNAVLELAPDEARAQRGLWRVERAGEARERAERETAERERRLDEVRQEIEREKASREERELEAKREREHRVRDRRTKQDTQRRIDEHLRAGRDYFSRKQFVDAISEWREAAALTRPEDEKHKRALGWIEAARVMDVRERQRAARLKASQDEAGVRMRVLDDWSYTPPEQRWDERVEEERVEVISPERLRLMEQAEREISLNVERKHIRDVVRDLSRMTGINIAFDDTVFPRLPPPAAPEPAAPVFDEEMEPVAAAPAAVEAPVEGLESPYVTIYLRNIPFIEALDAILRTKGLNYRIEDHLIWITDEEKIEREGELVTRTYRPTGDLRSIVNTLREVIPFPPAEGAMPGSSLSADEISRTIFMTHTESFHQLAADLIRRLADMTPQISIEAKFVDVTLGELRQIGVQLGGLEPFRDVITQDDVLTIGDFRLGVSPSAQPRGIFMQYQKYTQTQFRAIMQAFEESSTASLLSAPKVTVLNRQEATIEVDYSISWVNAYSIQNTSVTRTVAGTSYTLTQSNWVVSDTDSKPVGVYLRVMPDVGGDRRRINLSLTPIITDFVRWMDISGTPLRSPVFSIRELQTSVDLNDGETIVMGGLVQGEELEGMVSLPVLGDIPVMGSLFKRRSRTSEKRELLIFVTARIIDPTGLPFFTD